MPVTELRNLGRSGLRVSPLCLGAMNFGNHVFGCDEETSLNIMDAAFDAGINFIDTANVYSETRSETIVGKAIKGRRDNLVIATKAAGNVGTGTFERGTSRKALMLAVEASLRRLDTDYIDLYQMHRFDPLTPMEETLSTLNDLVRQGKVRYIGVSNWTASQIADASRIIEQRGWEPLISLQPNYSILVREIELEIVPACLRFGLGIIPWSPLAGGVLTGKYGAGDQIPEGTRLAAQPQRREILQRSDVVGVVLEEAAKLGVSPVALSLAWNLRRPAVASPIIGPKSVQQLEQNLEALDVDLPQEVIDRIDAASAPQLFYPFNMPPSPPPPPTVN